jgi:predicted O-methyltransferase YrrM
VDQLTYIPIRERLRPGLMGHRTPRYAYARARQLLYERRNPDAPWLTPQATRLLEPMLLPSDRGLEFGSGRSTIWFARRTAHLTSVEHDAAWHAEMSRQLKELELGNVDYILAPLEQPAELGAGAVYARAALAFADASLDYALIDGACREHTARHVLPKIKAGGILVIDNVNWYLPAVTRSPGSRTPDLGPAGPVWTEIAAELARWRCIWTSSGVWDTAIYVRPGLA